MENKYDEIENQQEKEKVVNISLYFFIIFFLEMVLKLYYIVDKMWFLNYMYQEKQKEWQFITYPLRCKDLRWSKFAKTIKLYTSGLINHSPRDLNNIRFISTGSEPPGWK